MHTLNLKEAARLSGQLLKWAYNALDCVATFEIADVLAERMDAPTERYYRFEMASQLPAFAMTMRGTLVDTVRQKDALRQVNKDLRRLTKEIAAHPTVLEKWDMQERVTGECPSSTRKDGRHSWERGVEDTPERTCTACGRSRFQIKPFNPASSDQCTHLLYGCLGLPEQTGRTGKVTTDEDALDALRRKFPTHADLLTMMLEVRNLKKQRGFLDAYLTPDDRYMSTFNVGAAWTGRWSSNKDYKRRGGNKQNIAERHRSIFVADPGMDLCYFDLKQAESNLVAHLAGDEKYILAHKSGDVHTFVTRFIWPELPWTGDLKQDKLIAKQNPEWDQAPGHDLRFQSKRFQHGSNYGLTYFGVARANHIPQAAAKTSMIRYHNSFPGIRVWQRSMAGQVQERAAIQMPFGHAIKLFGRPWDKHTINQALSLQPQGTVAHIINVGVWRLYMEVPEADLQAQVHDAALFQLPEGRPDLQKRALAAMTVPIPIKDTRGNVRVATIEVEGAVGKNWGHRSTDNPDGVEEIK